MPTFDEAAASVAGGQPQQPKRDPFDLAAESVVNDQRTKQRATLFDAVRVNPDQAAKAKVLERDTGTPTDVILRNLQDVELQAAVEKVDAGLTNASKTLRNYFSTSDFARMSHDDLNSLLGIDYQMRKDYERGHSIGPYRGPEATPGSVLYGLAMSPVQGFKAAREGLGLQMSDLFETLGIFKLNEAEKANQLRKAAQAGSASLWTTPAFESRTAGAIYGGVASTLQQAPGLALSVATRSPTPMLASAGLMTEAQSYTKYRARGATPGMAALAAGGEGAVEVATELLPSKFLTDALGKAGMREFFTGLLAREIPGEQAATLLQDAIDTAVTNPDKTWGQYFAERPMAAYETLVSTVTQSTIMGGISQTARILSRDQQKLETSDKQLATFEQMMATAGQSKLRERSPETFAQFVNEAATDAGAPTHVYVDARALTDALNQAGIPDEQLAQSMPSVPAQIAQAFESGGVVEIPVGEALAVAPGTPLEQVLLQNARLDPEGLSRLEVDEAAKQGDQFVKQAAEAIVKDAQTRLEHEDQVAQIRQTITDQLNQAGRFRPEANGAYATMVGAFYSTMAQRTGMTPAELYAKYPLKVTGEMQSGQLEQGNDAGVPLTPGAGQVKDGSTTVDYTVSQDGKRVEVNMVKTPEADRGQGAARRAMQHVLDMADKAGAQVVLTADPMDKKTSKPKLEKFYKSLGFTPNKGRAKDFTTMAGMVREPKADTLAQQTRATFSPEQMLIALGPNADYSSFLHESGHAFLEILSDVASQPGAPEQIVKDWQTTLDWFGIKGIEQVGGADAGGALAQQSDAFTKWFGDSKVVDAEGKPLVVYHGTNAKITEFKNAKKGERDPGFFGNGFYFTPNEDDALNYADSAAEADGAGESTVIPVYLSLQNPFVWDMEAGDGAKATRNALASMGIQRSSVRGDSAALGDDTERRKFMAGMKAAGHDGVIVRDEDGVREVVAFNPEQIKSATGNDGTFDANDPSILSQGGTPTESAPIQIQRTPMETWRAMTLDQKRPYHERWAESTEQYFFEGKAPSVELRGVFDRFRTWLMTVYKSLKAFLASRSATPGGQGSTLAQSAPGTDAFTKWFGDSKVVDANGEPLVVYHGTNATFNAFNVGKIKSFNEGVGLYFTNNPDVAGSYGKPLSVYLSLQKPLAYDAAAFKPPVMQKVLKRAAEIEAKRDEMDLEDGFLSNYGDVRSDGLARVLRDAAAQLAREESANDQIGGIFNAGLSFEVLAEAVRDVTGHDGFIAKGFSNEGDSANTIYVAWFPEQIKSATGNAGTFDPNNPNIYAQSDSAGPLGLTDEIRAVMDRLLATDDQIAEMERVREYGLLFKSPEEAGMTPEQWAKYTSEDEKAHAAALTELSKRSLRDMGIVMRKRMRALKDVQADMAEKRKDVEAEAAELVAKEPIYRAMRWLKKGEALDAEGNVVKTEGDHKLDSTVLAELYPEVDLSGLKGMTKKGGLHPDLVAEQLGYDSGDQLVQALLGAFPQSEQVQGLTDQMMLERYGDLTTTRGQERAADEAVHNENRARVLAAEFNALSAARQSVNVVTKAAKLFAENLVRNKKVGDLKPAQHSAAETRAAKAAEKALAAGKTNEAVQAKRDQVLQFQAARATLAAQEEVAKGLTYLKKFDKESTRKGLDVEYTDQIDKLLERVELRERTIRELDKREKLAAWIKSQEEIGVEPDIPDYLAEDVQLQNYKRMTVDEFRGLIAAVKQIEHLGRLKKRLLTAKDKREFAAVVEDLVGSIIANGKGRKADTRTPADTLGSALLTLRNFGAAHIKAATWARILDGGKDGGPMWERFVRGANEAGDKETTMRAEATEALTKIMLPWLKGGKTGGKGKFFPSINRSLNRQQVLAIALNTGNESNLQRLLGGEGWTLEQLQPVLDTVTAADWQVAQQVWDYFESLRPQVAEMERDVFGKEPDWIAPGSPVTQRAGIKGGYYPVKYDPLASQRAEQHQDAEAAKRQLQGAYSAATVRKSFTKGRAEEVVGRPLLYTLGGVYSGINDTIHYLAWQRWLVDTNRLLRSRSVDAAIRNTYGPEVVKQFRTWRDAAAEGESGVQEALDTGLGKLRQSVSVAGLGFNVMSALMQPLGFTQSTVRIGPQWMAKGLQHYIANPVAASREANEKSSFMENRARTRFREINELRNRVSGETTARRVLNENAYRLMMTMQRVVDVPTWWGAYEKAIADGQTEERAVDLADQAVIDSQGGGQTKDLSAIERGGPAQKLFTVFYSFMNTALNLATTSATTQGKAKAAADILLITVVPAVLGALMKAALTPGDSGDDDPEKLAKKLAGEVVGYFMGMFVIGREFAEAGKIALGLSDGAFDYKGPAGVRIIGDAQALAKQAAQGEIDDAFRKASINLAGDLFGLPSAQINRTVTGAKALAEGETQNPAALALGYQKPR